MNLFQINDQYEVELNKEWVLLIPEFAALIKADKGSPGDSEGRKKLKARKQLAYIYFMEDPRSPLFEWKEGDKKGEALKYASVSETDINTAMVQEARKVYVNIVDKCSRALRTYKAVLKSLDAMDTYYENIDFTATDKKGELLHNPSAFMLNIQRLKPAYDSLDMFRTKVLSDLKSQGAIRGSASLGYYEDKKDTRAGLYKEENTQLPEIPDKLPTETSIDNEDTIVTKDSKGPKNTFKHLGADLKSLLPGDNDEKAWEDVIDPLQEDLDNTIE